MPDRVNLSDAGARFCLLRAVPGARTSRTRQRRRLPPHTLIRPPCRRHTTSTNETHNNGERLSHSFKKLTYLF